MDLDELVRKSIDELTEMQPGIDPASSHGRADAILLSVLEADHLEGVAAAWRSAQSRVGFLYE